MLGSFELVTGLCMYCVLGPPGATGEKKRKCVFPVSLEHQ